MSNGTMVGAGILLIVIGLLLISGIIQALLAVVGFVGIAAGVIVGVIGLVGMIRGGGSRY